MFADRVLSGMRPDGPHAHRPLPRRPQELGAPAGGVRVPVLRRRLARADDALRDARGHRGIGVGDVRSTGSPPGSIPTRSTLFIQSRVTEHAELALLLGMMTPIGWLERVPTYKDQQQKLADRDLSTLRLPGLSGDAGRRHPDLPREHGAGRRGPGVARRVRRARSRAASTTSTAASRASRKRRKAAVKKLGAKKARRYERAAHGVPGEGRRRGAGSRARAAERHAEPGAGRPRAALRLSRRLAPR